MYWGFSEAEGIRMIQNEAGDSPPVNMAGEYPNKAGFKWEHHLQTYHFP